MHILSEDFLVPFSLQKCGNKSWNDPLEIV